MAVSELVANARFTGSAPGDFFGKAVALSSEGPRALAGAISNSTTSTNAGAAYLFQPPLQHP
ncbi:MAG: FG-GAP repeat protein [Methanomicrobiales archaeon]